MHGLVGYNALEGTEPDGPVRLLETALDELSTSGECAQASPCKLVHGSREVEQDVLDVAHRTKNLLGEKARTRAKLQDTTHRRRGRGDFACEARKEFCSPRTLRQGRLLPRASIGHETQIDRTRN